MVNVESNKFAPVREGVLSPVTAITGAFSSLGVGGADIIGQPAVREEKKKAKVEEQEGGSSG